MASLAASQLEPEQDIEGFASSVALAITTSIKNELRPMSTPVVVARVVSWGVGALTLLQASGSAGRQNVSRPPILQCIAEAAFSCRSNKQVLSDCVRFLLAAPSSSLW